MPYKDPEARRAARKRYERANPGRRRSTRNTTRSVRRKNHELTFVAVDGEGVDRPDGEHEYNLLSIGATSLHHPDGSRLTTHDIFNFLWSNFDPKVVYVGFFLGYDFSQWLRDLPEEKAKSLLTTEGQLRRKRTDSHGNTIPFPVEWGPWEFDLLTMKRFKLRKAGAKSWMYVCDAGPMYQTSFAKAIDPDEWPEPICTADEYAIVTAGKAARSDNVVPRGTPVDETTVAYNQMENELLSRLMTRTNEGLVAMGVKLTKTQWHGPGQAAQAWLKNVAAAHTGEACRDANPPEAIDAARMSYFGGWFEIMAHGKVPGVTYEYDINSAYPSIIAGLPCLLHGSWSSGEGAPPRRKAAYRLVRCDVQGSDPYIGPMPHRTPHGLVSRPLWTSGWMWQHELEASRKAGLVDRVRWHEWWEYHPCDCPSPFASIATLYNDRLKVGKSSPQGKAMKLVYNSAYGKMAQSVGEPLYGNAIYASLITAGCRSMILEAIATHPQRSAAVVMVATDGVYFTSPHPALDLDPGRLGAWDSAEKRNLTLFKPGVYWDDKARRAVKEGGKLGLKSRGVNERALAGILPDLDRQWAGLRRRWQRTPQLKTDPHGWPWATISVPFSVISPKQALNRGKWHLCGSVEKMSPREEQSFPKRKRGLRTPENPPDDLIRTRPRRAIGPTGTEVPISLGEPSTPYEERFGAEIKERSDELPIIPEGELELLLAEMFGMQ